MFTFKLNPLTKVKIKRFKSIKRGYYSFLIFITLIILAIFGELFVNSRALIVKHEGKFYFPTYGDIIPGSTFGFDYAYETNYRDLKDKFAKENSGNWLIMPIIPYNEYENDLREYYDANNQRLFPPLAPNFESKHYLGTDTIGRDIVARLFYGFRTSISFALTFMICAYTIGITIGCIMGFFGGKIDLIGQRFVEIWANIPFLYTIIILSSLTAPSFGLLAFIMVLFGWISMASYMRTSTYREKARDYVLAARTLGASNSRIIFKHILSNSVSLIVTFMPFTISSSIVSVTTLDFLGFGLPAPTPSWGELLKQGTNRLDSPWIVWSVIISMICVLMMVTFTGEAVREAFDPKRHTTYE